MGLVLLALVAAFAYALLTPPARATTYVGVTRGDIRATVNANARVRPERSARLAFQSSGLVTSVRVKEGDAVKAGDVLATVQRDERERRVRQAELALQSRQLDLARAQDPPSAAELEIAQQNLKKAALARAAAENRYKDDPTDTNRIAQELAQADYEIARANFDRATRTPSDAELQALKNSVENAQIDLTNARQALAETELTAPFDGVITEVNLREGELIGGFNPVIGLADLTRLDLLAEIDEIDISEVKEGQSAELRFDAFPGGSATGTVALIFPAASTDRGATLYRAVIALNPTELALRPGMGATVKIATVEKKDVLMVPARTIKNAGTQKIVTVREGSGTRNVVVETGLSDGNETEIVRGLQEGELVAIE